MDYRELNALTWKDTYPLTRNEEFVTTLKQVSWYSILSLASGYWQVGIDPKIKKSVHSHGPL